MEQGKKMKRFDKEFKISAVKMITESGKEKMGSSLNLTTSTATDRIATG